MYIIKNGTICELSARGEREFVSPFAEELFSQHTRSWQLDAWKHKEDQGNGEQGVVPRSMLWGGSRSSQPARMRAVHLCSAPGRLYYVLEMSNSCGLFYYDFAKDQEFRLFHRTDFKPHGLFVNENLEVLTTTANTDGTVHLALLDPEGKRETVITSGDCLDENPCQSERKVYYQSSGIARGDQAQILAIGPTSICALDLDSGEVETVLSSNQWDYLLPRLDRDGRLYCLRVPTRANPTYSAGQRVLDILLFPWRLAVAVFAFLNVFSMFFAKKPLTRAGGPTAPALDISQRILHNRVINLQETMKREGRKVAVSREWKLMRREQGNLVETASNVLWYDLDQNGNPIYTDGYAVFDSVGGKRASCDELVSSLTLKQNPAVTVGCGRSQPQT